MKEKNKIAFYINSYPISWSFIWKLKRKYKLDAYMIDRIMFLVAQNRKIIPIPYIVKGLKDGWLLDSARNLIDKYDPKFISRWISCNIYSKHEKKKEFTPAIDRKRMPDSIGEILKDILNVIPVEIGEKMNPTNEFWPELTHTWNPMYGCKRGCGYCYARTLHNKRMEAKKKGAKLSKRYDKPFDEIQFFPEDLMKIPKKSRVIKKVFVCNMGDICYQKPENIELVLGICRRRPEMTFMFLTKDPTVYEWHSWPINCQLGVTITGAESIGEQWNRLAIIERLPNYTFISYEPMAGLFLYTPHECVNMIIVGADSRKHNPIVPEQAWIDRVKEFEKTHNVHYKNNIKKYL